MSKSVPPDISSLREALGVDLENIYWNLPIPLCVIDRDGCFLYANRRHEDLAGIPADALIGVEVRTLNARAGVNIARDFQTFDTGGRVPNHEIQIGDRHYMVSVSPVVDKHGGVPAITVAHFDITAKKAVEHANEHMKAQLERLARRDHLTNLLNRRSFDYSMGRYCERLIADDTDFGLILFDIDHFKSFNDVYGHPEGDACLQQIARAIEALLERRDYPLFRYGGEEFAVLVEDPSLVEDIAREIIDTVRNLAITHENSERRIVTASCGFGSTTRWHRPIPASVGRRLLKAVDDALYEAKRNGRDTLAGTI